MREAGSADEGLAAIEEAKPDLVLLDVMMPHVDGWEMLRRIQERYGAGAIPVVMFSGKVDEQAQAQAASSAARRASSASRSTCSSSSSRRSSSLPSDRARPPSRALGRRTTAGTRSNDVFVWLSRIGTLGRRLARARRSRSRSSRRRLRSRSCSSLLADAAADGLASAA